ncbi:hypothetical protein RJ640_023953 [Escallonia rubra]|uniref:Aminotransferase-like plant mobile domain-containing protein n=1 Tax=Escallonia rubra TaxID=112253 RepID=A0AA88RMD7_9ASTE|nr:hypothetical protein RJ640_023953 [Escallonia rubra]
MRKKKLLTLPEFYILPRWSTNVRFRASNLGLSAIETDFSKSAIIPLILWSIRKKVNKVIEDGMDFPSEVRQLNECLDSFLAEQAIRKNANQLLNDERLSQLNSDACISQVEHMHQISIRDPAAPVKTKGRPKIATRLKSGLELAKEAKKQRTYSNCGITNVGGDSAQIGDEDGKDTSQPPENVNRALPQMILLIYFYMLQKMDFNPGPEDSSVLYDQASHISTLIWDGGERALVNTVEVSDNFNAWKLNRTQKRLLRGIGFGIFTHGQIFQQLDRHLIGALVERWRSETNTFHFPLGEMTITLEDVGFILGLPVTGRPVIAHPSEATNKRTARDFFTSIPQDGFSSGGIKLKWLVDTYGVLPENYTGHDLVLYTQAFLLWVMGAILFPTTSKNTVSVKYLPFLRNLAEVGDYAWGAATLAYLYRALHKATRPDSKAICACLSLLQVWSYEHLATGAPRRRDGTDNVWPRLCAWEYSRKETHYERRDDPHHNISYYRGELDSLSPGQMRWAPYKRLARWVGESFVFTLSGLQRTPLIHFEVAEWQLPDRAMRHFDCLQGLPADAPDMRLNRNPPGVGLFGRANAHELCAREVEVWNSWQDTLAAIVSEPDPVISIEQYNEWYYRITRRRVAPVRFERGEKYHPRGQIDEQMAYNLVNASFAFFQKLSERKDLVDAMGEELRQQAEALALGCGNFLRYKTHIQPPLDRGVPRDLHPRAQGKINGSVWRAIMIQKGSRKKKPPLLLAGQAYLQTYVKAAYIDEAPATTVDTYVLKSRLLQSLKQALHNPHSTNDDNNNTPLTTLLSDPILKDDPTVLAQALLGSALLRRRGPRLTLDYWRLLVRGDGKIPCTESFNMVMDLYGRNENHSEAVKIFRALVKENRIPNTRTYSIMIEHLASAGKFKSAKQVFDILPRMRIKRTVKQYSVLLGGFTEMKSFDVVESLICEMRLDGILPGQLTRLALQSMMESGLMKEHSESEKDDDEDESFEAKPTWPRVDMDVDPHFFAEAFWNLNPEMGFAMEGVDFEWTTPLVCKVIKESPSS